MARPSNNGALGIADLERMLDQRKNELTRLKKRAPTRSGNSQRSTARSRRSKAPTVAAAAAAAAGERAGGDRAVAGRRGAQREQPARHARGRAPRERQQLADARPRHRRGRAEDGVQEHQPPTSAASSTRRSSRTAASNRPAAALPDEGRGQGEEGQARRRREGRAGVDLRRCRRRVVSTTTTSRYILRASKRIAVGELSSLSAAKDLTRVSQEIAGDPSLRSG